MWHQEISNARSHSKGVDVNLKKNERALAGGAEKLEEVGGLLVCAEEGKIEALSCITVRIRCVGSVERTKRKKRKISKKDTSRNEKKNIVVYNFIRSEKKNRNSVS